jgi:hypothetical protein
MQVRGVGQRVVEILPVPATGAVCRPAFGCHGSIAWLFARLGPRVSVFSVFAGPTPNGTSRATNKSNLFLREGTTSLR